MPSTSKAPRVGSAPTSVKLPAGRSTVSCAPSKLRPTCVKPKVPMSRCATRCAFTAAAVAGFGVPSVPSANSKRPARSAAPGAPAGVPTRTNACFTNTPTGDSSASFAA